MVWITYLWLDQSHTLKRGYKGFGDPLTQHWLWNESFHSWIVQCYVRYVRSSDTVRLILQFFTRFSHSHLLLIHWFVVHSLRPFQWPHIWLNIETRLTTGRISLGVYDVSLMFEHNPLLVHVYIAGQNSFQMLDYEYLYLE